MRKLSLIEVHRKYEEPYNKGKELMWNEKEACLLVSDCISIDFHVQTSNSFVSRPSF